MKQSQTPISASAVIVAAGSGTRMGNNVNKQFLLIDGIPVLARTLLAFSESELIEKIIVVAKSDEILTVQDLVRDFGIQKVAEIVSGGNTRAESVRHGLEYSDSEITAVHDGARPFVSTEKIRETILAAHKLGAAALGSVPKDTVKIVADSGNVLSTPDRQTLRLIQTPQVFRTELLKSAYKTAELDGFVGTDDCSVAEHAQIPVHIIDGEYTNIKITTAEDIPIAESICRFLGDRRD